MERSFGDAEGLLWQERLESGLTDEELGVITIVNYKCEPVQVEEKMIN